MPRRETAPLGAPCWIDLFSSDTAKARSFYAELFGWTGEEATEEFGGYSNFGKDGVRVAGCMHNDGSSGSPDGWNTYLATDDAVKTNAAAVAHGATAYVEPMQVGPYGSMGLLGTRPVRPSASGNRIRTGASASSRNRARPPGSNSTPPATRPRSPSTATSSAGTRTR